MTNTVPSRGGSIKFDNSLSADTLWLICQEWPQHFPHGTFIDLHIRKGGDDGSHYIAFRARLKTGSEQESIEFDNYLIQNLHHRLGTHKKRPRGLLGWSISGAKFSI